MKLSEFKSKVENVDSFNIQIQKGIFIPSHFHITEMGLITKNFIDCGNTIREEKVVTFQVWFANDFDHRLAPEKVLKIINASEKLINNQDLDIEVEYQTNTTIGKYGLDFEKGIFILTPKQTNCLASDHCGITIDKEEVGEKKEKIACCAPESGCC